MYKPHLTLPFFACLAVFTGCRSATLPITLENPVVRLDTADPSIVYWEDDLYSYSTSGCSPKGSLHIRKKTNGDEWRHAGFILAKEEMPDWIGGCDFWAPEVHHVGDQWIAYFSARDQNQNFCIGAAVADHPAGPFTPLPQPVVGNPKIGLIDASFFHDPQTDLSYLLWKEDRNALNPQEPTPIIMAPVSSDGLTISEDRIQLISNDQEWEGDLVEAPQLIFQNDWYYLFYSGNSYYNENYGVGVARSKNAEGPYIKYIDNPFIYSDPEFEGTGHSFITDLNGRLILFYHARERASGNLTRNLMAKELLCSDDMWWLPAPVIE